MASYRVAQLGLGWAVFCVDASIELVAGPFESRGQALEGLRTLPIGAAPAAVPEPTRRPGRSRFLSRTQR